METSVSEKGEAMPACECVSKESHRISEVCFWAFMLIPWISLWVGIPLAFVFTGGGP